MNQVNESPAQGQAQTDNVKDLDGSPEAGSPSAARSQNPLNIGKVQTCEDCGEVFTITRRYDFCRNCFCPECGGEINKNLGYCAICSLEAERFEDMAYGRDD